MSEFCSPNNCSSIGVLQLKVDNLRAKLEMAEKEMFADGIVLQGAKNTLREVVNERDELSEKIGQLEKYAELGKLAIKALDEFDVDDSSTRQCECTHMGYENDCVCNRCSWSDFCQKRAELLAEVQK